MNPACYLIAAIVSLPFFSSCAEIQGSGTAQSPLSVKSADKTKIAKAIWRNECGGSVEGLTSWNKGENFPSLGIGHFIWYPAGKKEAFEESFPSFIRYAKSAGGNPPSWTYGSAPWATRDAFLKDINSSRMIELRKWLASTTELQADYIIARSVAALPKLKTASKNPAALEKKYKAIASTPNGVYALIDYVNFKGEGINPSERYRGEGWGLAQVLDDMPDVAAGQSAAHAFSGAARRVLARRVTNSPPARNESQWLAGWQKRCDTYSRPL